MRRCVRAKDRQQVSPQERLRPMLTDTDADMERVQFDRYRRRTDAGTSDLGVSSGSRLNGPELRFSVLIYVQLEWIVL